MKPIHLFVAIWSALLLVVSSSEAQSYPPAWSAGSSYAVGDQVQLSGNVLRAVRAVSPGSFKYSYWELWDVRANTTIIVGTGGQFPTLATAWNYALNCRIARGAYLHLYIAGTHSEIFDAPFSLDHPSGAQISVIGQNEAGEVFSFNGVDGFTLDNGYALGGLSNLSVQGSNSVGTPTLTSGTHGILVSTGGTLHASNVALSYFDAGLAAASGGTLICGITGNAGSADTVTFFGACGVSATDHSLIEILSPMTLDGRTSAVDGFLCTAGSEMLANSCTAKNCTQYEFAAEGAYLGAENSLANGGGLGGTCYYATFEGHVDALASEADNAYYGFLAISHASIDASSSLVSQSGANTFDYAASNAAFVRANSNVGSSKYDLDGNTTLGVNAVGSLGSVISIG